MSDYGEDFGGVDDIDANLSIVTGLTALTQALARRLSTPRGSLFYDSEYGTDIRQWQDAGAPSDREIEQLVERECLKDERVDRVRVVSTRVGENLTIQIAGAGDAGPFDFTLFASALTVELLSEQMEFDRP